MTDEMEVMSIDSFLDAALTSAYSWYGPTLPTSISAAAFYRFAAQSRELVEMIVPGIPMTVEAHAPSAYTDGKKIVFPAPWLTDVFYNSFRVPEEHHAAAACLLINGCQLHEAAHVKVTPMGFDRFVDLAKNAKAQEYLKKYKGFATSINIVEDQFIEEWLRYNYSGFTDFINGKNHVILGSTILDMTHQEWELRAAVGGKLPSVDDWLNVLSFCKTIELHDDVRMDFLRPFLDIVIKAQRFDCSIEDRIAIAVELWEALLDETGGEESEQNEGSSALSEPNERSNDTIDRNQIISALEDAMKELFAESGRYFKDIADEFRRELKKSEEEEEKTGDDEELIKPNRKTPMPEGRSLWGEIPPMIIKDVVDAHLVYDDSAKASTEWQRFGIYLRYLRQEKLDYSLPDTKGRKISKRHLANIITTGKVMVTRDSSKIRKGKPEVILLIDASGSMRGYSGDVAESLFEDVVNAAYGMFISLMRGGIPVSVYAHTSTSHHELAPLLYKVAAFRMPVFTLHAVSNGDFDRRFNCLAKIKTLENFDGFAIRQVSQQFTKSLGTKLIVVLSDGSPAGGGLYSGSEARNHTKQEIWKARRSGKHVISVSLQEGVVRTNDDIYGKDFNLHGFGVHLNPTLQRIAQSLALPPDV